MSNLNKLFFVSGAEMRKIIRDFHSEMDMGLLGRKSSLKMLKTYVFRPSGDEKGEFIALDLGGTNFRILEIELKGRGRVSHPRVMKFTLESKYITDTREKLFDFIASCVKKFLVKNRLSGSRVSLGFTFSFAVDQTAVDSGRLLHWTKGFSATGVIGKDVVGLLRDALKRKSLCNVDVTALVNDTVGTLAAKSYEDGNCDVGVIIGTGTNACYVERTLEEMIINTEWGNFNKLKRTHYDILLDRASDNKGAQTLEKMVSGMYLGEVARLVLCDKLGNNVCKSFDAEDMSSVLKGSPRIKGMAERDIGLVRSVCRLVALRAARVSAAALAAILTRMDPDLSGRHTIAIDGSVYEKLPGFSQNVRKALIELFGVRASRVKVVLAKDGSGMGAAIIAAAAGKRGLTPSWQKGVRPRLN